jgi:hypothetical protein
VRVLVNGSSKKALLTQGVGGAGPERAAGLDRGCPVTSDLLRFKKLTTRNRAPKLGARFFPSSRSARDWKYFSIPFRGRPSPSIGRTGKAFSGTHRPLCWTKPVERLDGYAARGVGGIGVDLMRPLRVAVPDQRRTAPLRFALHRIQDTWLS